MATSLLDSPPAQNSEQAAGTAPPAPDGQPSAPSPAAPQARACAQCGAPLAAGQDWCLQCGAGAPGSLAKSSWRPAAWVLASVLVLVLGAAAAGYAALNKGSHNTPAPTTIAQAPAPATAPVTPVTPGTPTTIKPAVPSTPKVKLPKIPLTASTPKVTPVVPVVPAVPVPSPKNKTGSTTPSETGTGGSGSGEHQPAAILLDTNAASSYNPYNYPAGEFGDPSLAIDGDSATGWTAQVDPSSAPKMAEGVLIDMKSRTRLASIALATSSPGMTVQVYGANGKTAPSSITDPAWLPLSHSQIAAKKHVRIKLRNKKKAFRFVTLWISRAPAASVGTPQAPGHVSVNELELFASH